MFTLGIAIAELERSFHQKDFLSLPHPRKTRRLHRTASDGVQSVGHIKLSLGSYDTRKGLESFDLLRARDNHLHSSPASR